MTTSADILPELVRLGGDLDHLSADLEKPSQVVDVARPCHRVSQEVTWHEQLAGEGVRFAFGLPDRPMHRVQEVVTKFVCDREALANGRFGGDNFDAGVDQARTEAAEAFDFDNLETDAAGDGVNRNRRLRDFVLDQDAAGHLAGMGQMRLLLTPGTARDTEQLPRPLVLVEVDAHSRGAALRTLILEARRGHEANPAFLLRAAQIRHNETETDYTAAGVPPIEGRHNPAAALISLYRRRFGDARTVEGATMDKKERRVFAEVSRLRSNQGLGEKLDRYRESRDQYERLLEGQRDVAPASSLPLQRSQRQASAHGRIRGIVDGSA
jgi:hypothetical protein